MKRYVTVFNLVPNSPPLRDGALDLNGKRPHAISPRLWR